MDKQLTNDIYRTKQKLELLNNSGIGQLIKDFCVLSKTEILDEEIFSNIKKLENKHRVAKAIKSILLGNRLMITSQYKIFATHKSTYEHEEC